MDRNIIKSLIREGTPISDMNPVEAFENVNNEVMKIYIMNGLHRNLKSETFNEEVRMCTAEICKELSTDPAYRSIRDKEIPYIFSNGLKGRLGADKDAFITYKNLIRWIDAYMSHQTRKDAFNELAESRRNQIEMSPMLELSDDRVRKMVVDAWEDFKQFKKTKGGQGHSIDEESRMSVMPISCRDFGRIRIDYLRRIGIAHDDVTIIDVFEKAIDGKHPALSASIEELAKAEGWA